MWPSVTKLTPPNPTAITLVPAALAVAAAAIAVLSLPPTVCTPSDSSTSTFGTPLRAPVPVTTDWPSSMPPDRNVDAPTPGALSSAVVIVASDGVRVARVEVTVSNSTYAICARTELILKWPTTARAKASTSGRCAPTDPELSTTSTRSTARSHGGGAVGGAGGSIGDGGGKSTATPHIWTASICSNPYVSVVTLSLFDTTLTSGETVSAEPHEVVSVACQMVTGLPDPSYASIFDTNGARYVSYTETVTTCTITL